MFTFLSKIRQCKNKTKTKKMVDFMSPVGQYTCMMMRHSLRSENLTKKREKSQLLYLL